MPVATFDTLKFANTLKAAGVPPQQAEAEAAAFAEVIQLNLKDLVTKDDLDRVAKAAKDDLTREVDTLRKELRQEIKDAEQRLAARIDSLAADAKTVRAEQRGEMVLIKWMLGVAVTGIVTLVIRMFLFRGTI